MVYDPPVGDHDTMTSRPGIAIVGMAGRFPGARDVTQFWDNIKAGRETITRFSPEDLDLPIEGATAKNGYVCAKGMLDDIDMFDARFFGYLPREAELMDPQQRVFLEIAHEALEQGGLDPERYPGAVGVFAGCYMDTYVFSNLCADEAFRRDLVDSFQVGSLQTELGNDKDYLATRVAFKLGLRGPAMTVQTACSTSLVAIATACQSLESYACDAALAGGVTIVLPQTKGYFYKEGGMLSPDGHCRPFDEQAAGTVFSNGAAVVLLKRLDEALADGDRIYAVIRGYATNNDGGDKLSYTAPSVEGQAEVISLALQMADIDAGTIGYVEAHGTATPLGDPIEIAGLTKAYRGDGKANGYCAIGSVKANLGHLDVASGAIGLIKTSLALDEKTIPPQINFSKPNPKIDFEQTPFRVETALTPWQTAGHPRRAGVSSFGVGGTNAHLVLEEAPEPETLNIDSDPQIFVVSARTDHAVETQAQQLADHLDAHRDLPLADVAWTLQTGRRSFDRRCAVVGATRDELVEALRAPGKATRVEHAAPEPVFVFPGQGAQYPGMGRGLYQNYPVFRQIVDELADSLVDTACLDQDIRTFLLWTEGDADREGMANALSETRLAQPAIFVLQYATARLLESFGIKPGALLGHSIGEFAAACLAGIMEPKVAACLVAQRGALMQAADPGSMLAVRLPETALTSRLPDGVVVAAINSPDVTIVSGPTPAIDALAGALGEDDIHSSKLKTSHAFHSPMMAEPAKRFAEVFGGVSLRPPMRTIISTLTGEEADTHLMSTPDYWSRQILSPVRFADAVAAAGVSTARIFVEIGPGRAMTGMIRQILEGEKARPALAAPGSAQMVGDDQKMLLSALGDLWCHGLSPDWQAVHGRQGRKVPLPTYPFERKRFWVDPPEQHKTPEPAGRADSEPQLGETSAEALVRKQLEIIDAQLKALRQG